MLVCFLINAFLARYLDLINKICIFWTAASVVIILVTLLSMSDQKHSGAFVFGHYDASLSGWPDGWAFLSASFSSLHLDWLWSCSIDVRGSSESSKREYLELWFYLLQQQVSQPIGLLFKIVTGSAAGGFGLLFLLLGILLFAGTGALTAASRCTYAFARDGAIPAFNSFTGVAPFVCLVVMVCQFLSQYCVDGSFESPVTPSNMNYASVVFVGFASFSVFWYAVRGRKHFTGPPVPEDAMPVIDEQIFGVDGAEDKGVVQSKIG
ncbi:hypothetical protein MRB53_039348 [Persea americana]|nr:hypothetical protein MRB53_039348 [Persea americana]